LLKVGNQTHHLILYDDHDFPGKNLAEETKYFAAQTNMFGEI